MGLQVFPPSFFLEILSPTPLFLARFPMGSPPPSFSWLTPPRDSGILAHMTNNKAIYEDDIHELDSYKFIIVKINKNSERAFIPLLYNALPNRVKVFSSIEEAKKTIEGAAIALGIDIEWNTECDSYICETTDLVDGIKIEIWRIWI
jgi:hypothetical protein